MCVSMERPKSSTNTGNTIDHDEENILNKQTHCVGRVSDAQIEETCLRGSSVTEGNKATLRMSNCIINSITTPSTNVRNSSFTFIFFSRPDHITLVVLFSKIFPIIILVKRVESYIVVISCS